MKNSNKKLTYLKQKLDSYLLDLLLAEKAYGTESTEYLVAFVRWDTLRTSLEEVHIY